MKLTPEKAESSNGIFLMNFNVFFVFYSYIFRFKMVRNCLHCIEDEQSIAFFHRKKKNVPR